MLYRILAAVIVVFWLTMTGLLLRKELGPADSALREVPLEHVVRLLVQREQSSDLQLFYEKALAGHLRIQPQQAHETGRRQLTAAGWVHLALPGSDRQRIAWSGELELDDALRAQRARATINLREPAGFVVDLTVDFAGRQVRLDTRAGTQVLRRSQYSLDEDGARRWLRDQGLDPELLGSLQGPAASSLEIHAQQSALAVRGEKIETYLVSAQQSGQTLFEAHVSQLGQILRVRTLFGYSAAPEELTP